MSSRVTTPGLSGYKRPQLPFLISAGIVIVFGSIDFFLQDAFLFKFEASLGNTLLGLFFAGTLFRRKTIIQEFAEAKTALPATLSDDDQFYFRVLTIVWSFYFFGKSLVYLWIATQFGMEKGLIVRTVIGNASFVVLLFVTLFSYRPSMVVLRWAGFLPSSRPLR